MSSHHRTNKSTGGAIIHHRPTSKRQALRTGGEQWRFLTEDLQPLTQNATTTAAATINSGSSSSNAFPLPPTSSSSSGTLAITSGGGGGRRTNNDNDDEGVDFSLHPPTSSGKPIKVPPPPPPPGANRENRNLVSGGSRGGGKGTTATTAPSLPNPGGGGGGESYEEAATALQLAFNNVHGFLHEVNASVSGGHNVSSQRLQQLLESAMGANASGIDNVEGDKGGGFGGGSVYSRPGTSGSTGSQGGQGATSHHRHVPNSDPDPALNPFNEGNLAVPDTFKPNVTRRLISTLFASSCNGLGLHQKPGSSSGSSSTGGPASTIGHRPWTREKAQIVSVPPGGFDSAQPLQKPMTAPTTGGGQRRPLAAASSGSQMVVPPRPPGGGWRAQQKRRPVSQGLVHGEAPEEEEAEAQAEQTDAQVVGSGGGEKAGDAGVDPNIELGDNDTEGAIPGTPRKSVTFAVDRKKQQAAAAKKQQEERSSAAAKKPTTAPSSLFGGMRPNSRSFKAIAGAGGGGGEDQGDEAQKAEKERKQSLGLGFDLTTPSQRVMRQEVLDTRESHLQRSTVTDQGLLLTSGAFPPGSPSSGGFGGSFRSLYSSTSSRRGGRGGRLSNSMQGGATLLEGTPVPDDPTDPAHYFKSSVEAMQKEFEFVNQEEIESLEKIVDELKHRDLPKLYLERHSYLADDVAVHSQLEHDTSVHNVGGGSGRGAKKNRGNRPGTSSGDGSLNNGDGNGSIGGDGGKNGNKNDDPSWKRDYVERSVLATATSKSRERAMEEITTQGGSSRGGATGTGLGGGGSLMKMMMGGSFGGTSGSQTYVLGQDDQSGKKQSGGLTLMAKHRVEPMVWSTPLDPLTGNKSNSASATAGGGGGGGGGGHRLFSGSGPSSSSPQHKISSTSHAGSPTATNVTGGAGSPLGGDHHNNNQTPTVYHSIGGLRPVCLQEDPVAEALSAVTAHDTVRTNATTVMNETIAGRSNPGTRSPTGTVVEGVTLTYQSALSNIWGASFEHSTQEQKEFTVSSLEQLHLLGLL